MFIQPANEALAAMVENCNPSRALTTLVNAGISHCTAAVRTSVALNIGRLLDALGSTRALTSSKDFTKQSLLAVYKILQSCNILRSYNLVRFYRQREVWRFGNTESPFTLNSLHTMTFQKLWKNFVPEKDRWLKDSSGS